MSTKKNIFVLGLTDVQRRELKTVRHAEEYAFHGVLDYDTLVNTTDLDFDQLMHDARAELDAFDGSIDAIIAHWDFPVSVMAALLAAEHSLPSPSLTSLLRSEHKGWSRLEQQKSVPECVPGFALFDPFADDPLASIDLDFPFWVKPVKAHSSALGFKVEDEEDFAEAVTEIREHIGEIGDAFDQVLRRVALPEELEGAGGNSCLAEQFVQGIQAAPEGTMFRGEFNVHGVFDMHKDEAGTSFSRLDYPASTVPESVQQRMIDLTERYLRQVGYDNGCFNSEFMWDEAEDQLWLIEINTRISQSHSDLFTKVDGCSNHEVAIDIALGQEPQMPHREGDYAVASQMMIFHDEDAIVTRIPTEQDRAEIERRFPGAVLTLMVEEGDRLSELPGQDSYRFVLGKLYLGADSTEQLLQRYAEITAELPFEFAAAPTDD